MQLPALASHLAGAMALLLWSGRMVQTCVQRAYGLRLGTCLASALQLQLVRDLKRVNGCLAEATVYPILEAEGALLPSRLRMAD